MPSIINATTSTGLVSSADNSGSLQLATNSGTTAVTINTSQQVGIGTTSPTANTQVDIASADASQQFVDVLRLKTTSTGDRHPSILFENNRSSVANALKLCMDSTDSAGTGEFTLRIKDSGGTFNTRLNVSNDGLLRFNSGYGSVATAYGCRAWVNFNGTGTPAIRASGNVSSITDNGTGLYTLNFTTAMPDANYSLVCTGGELVNGYVYASDAYTTAPTTSSARTINHRPGVGNADSAYLFAAVFR
jgi:hypothetical protein